MILATCSYTSAGYTHVRQSTGVAWKVYQLTPAISLPVQYNPSTQNTIPVPESLDIYFFF